MAAGGRVVLHEYKTTVFLLMIPLFAVIGCLMLVMSFGLPRLLLNAEEPSVRVSLTFSGLAGVGMPLLAIGLWLSIPAMTTSYDPARRVVVVVRRRPLGRSVAEYRVDDIAEIRPVGVGSRSYALHLILKNKDRVRLEQGSTSDSERLRLQAEKMAQTVGLKPAPREIRL